MTDKGLHCYSLGRQRNLDCIEMVRIARGVDMATIDREPSVMTVVNTNSPLRLDIPMAQGMIEFARHNQPVVVTPFTLAGAMAPITLGGALAQQNAEALAGIAFMQIVNPGSPVMYGGFTSNVDMQSGAPAFGTPEYVRTAMISGQLCRRYGVPYRSSNVCAANTLDAQAAYESVFSLWGAVMGGVNLLMHGAGMDGGWTACVSMDEVASSTPTCSQMVAALLRADAWSTTSRSLAFDAIRGGRPRRPLLRDVQHTQDTVPRRRSTSPLLSDWRNYESMGRGRATRRPRPRRWRWPRRPVPRGLRTTPDRPVRAGDALRAYVASSRRRGWRRHRLLIPFSEHPPIHT